MPLPYETACVGCFTQSLDVLPRFDLANHRSLLMAGPPARQHIDIRPGRPGSCQPTEVGQGQGGMMPSLTVKQSGETVRGNPEPDS